jgi:RNA polymerase sigma-70 factor (ECF subfamily)
MTEDAIGTLLMKVAGSDRAAFRRLYAESSAKLFAVLLRILGTRAEAEDALQEVYTRVWLRAGRYDPARGAGMTWLVAIARNLAIDRLRSRPASRTEADSEVIDTLADDRPDAENRLLVLGEARRIVDCLGQLEPDRSAAIQGAYLKGLSYQQLAERHGVPLNTMRTWLRRSLLRLRECMDQ